ncbi:hypothetical protein TRFO_04641 [Tritrichomonas foetus]|uniref:Uncharacterized protein n=1 Tax=Tritrichomonas foetus TaxID=1144522 RepID=A0A1J4KCX5_9EUKA|nr:hypothetical protein TRFO_04641 [Tritrichomonas foetus]|eukprot:OHT09067.1 hypothetical protein TRFO_04641 [Tritrichomonas foetus]
MNSPSWPASNLSQNEMEKYLEKDDISYLATCDRSFIGWPHPLTVDLLGKTITGVQPSLYCAIKNKPKHLHFLLCNLAHYPCIPSPNNITPRYTPDGHNLLHLSIINNSTECVKIIAKYAYPSELINLPIRNKNTPLHLAINTGNLEIVSTLLKYGADPLIKNSKNDTPFHLALNSNAGTDIARIVGNYIIEKTPDAMASFLTEKYCRNRTPIEVFKQLKRTEIVALLTEFQQMIEQSEPPKKKDRCTIKHCSQHKRIQKCHICFELFCPKHIDMHFHKGDELFDLS